MSPLFVATVVLVFLVVSFLIGIYAHRFLPEEHFQGEFKFVMELSVGLIAAMTALVLGLLTASTKNSFDEQDGAIKQIAANLFEIDRLLLRYGPETNLVREALKVGVAKQIENIWGADSANQVKQNISQSKPPMEIIEDYIYGLTPNSEQQKEFRSRTLELVKEISGTRWKAFTNASTTVPLAFLVVLIFWLSVLFASFGLMTPLNSTAFMLLFLAAVSVAGGVFVILEMGDPFSGLIKVSRLPLDELMNYLSGQIT